MKEMRKLIAAVSVLAVCAASAAGVWAEYDPNKVIDPSNPIMTTKAAIPNSVTVNGAPVDGANTYEADGFTMVPVRAISDALGIEVHWNGEASRIELTKAPLYATLQVGVDGYTFAKMAPQPLGKAPELNGDLTYVPLALFSDLLGANVTMNGSAIDISFESGENQKEKGDAVIKEVSDAELLVTDAELGDIRLALYDGLEIKDEEGKAVDKKDLKAGMDLKVDYSEQMGFSLPPFNAPKSITVLSSEKEAAVYSSATVTAVAQQTVTVQDETWGEVVLNITKDTVIKDKDGKAITIDALKKDDAVKVKLGPVMTASIPPINTPEEILVTEGKPEATTLTVQATVKEAEENRLWLECETGDFKEIVAIISDETVITGPSGEKLDASVITEGTRLEAELSRAMTRSLPPQSHAVAIKVLKTAR